MSDAQLKTEDEWRAEFERRGFSLVKDQYMHGSYFHGPVRAYAHKWLGEQATAEKRTSLATLSFARKAAVFGGVAAIAAVAAMIIALVQLIVTWPHDP